MSVINTNITSMIGQSNLSKSQGALQTSMERLSSGLRINSAKDDAAGQAIANRMTAQITGLNQASRNANDGISIAQTAEGSLNQINDNLQRIRELTVQAQNGTNSESDLGSIQDEVNQRLNEINRISEETDFNGVKVLSEDISTIAIQVGANDGEAISVNLETINQNTLDLDGFDLTSTLRAVSAADNAFRTENIDFDGTAASGFMNNSDAVTLELTNSSSTDITALGNFSFGGVDQDSDNFSIREFDGKQYAVGTAGGFENKVFTVDSVSLNSGEDAIDVALGEEVTGELARAAGDRGTTFDFSGGTGTSSFSVVTDGDVNYVREVTEDGNINYLTIDDTATGDSGVVTVNIGAAVGSELDDVTLDPMNQLDDALAKVDSLRSELGAVQNRFGDAITNLDTNATNLSSARSRIEDADYATEVANMTKAQILQQAGTSVLAQANQIPQNVLSLLG